MTRYAYKRDDNEAELLRVFRDLQVATKRLDPVVPGWPDLCAVVAGVPHFPEVKNDAGRLTKDQVRLREWLVSLGVKLDDYFPVLRTPSEVIEWVQARRRAMWNERKAG